MDLNKMGEKDWGAASRVVYGERKNEGRGRRGVNFKLEYEEEILRKRVRKLEKVGFRG